MFKKTFEKCLWEELLRVFGLEKSKNLPALSRLLQSDTEISPIIEQNLLRLNKILELE